MTTNNITMIEKVAKAIWSQTHISKWENDSMSEILDGVKADCREQARAAIIAMRKPTEEMREAGRIWEDCEIVSYDAIWEGMIDAALKC